MVVGRRLSLVIAALLPVLGIAAAVVASAEGVHAAPRGGGSPPEDVASSLVGTWTGMKSGAEGGKFESREWRVVFRTAEANAVIGSKQYRQPNGRWSKAERVNAVVDSTGHIWASDADGVLNGSLSEAGTLELIYQEPGTEDGAAVIALLSREEP
jgi:hypothetical protein